MTLVIQIFVGVVAFIAAIMAFVSYDILKSVKKGASPNYELDSDSIEAMYLKMYAVNTKLVTDIYNNLEKDDNGFVAVPRWVLKQRVFWIRTARFGVFGLPLFFIPSGVDVVVSSIVLAFSLYWLSALDEEWTMLAASNIPIILDANTIPPGSVPNDDDFDGKGF